MVLLHVEPAHVLGQAGGRRLHADELIGRLRSVAKREFGLDVQISRLLYAIDQLGNGYLTQNFPRPFGMAHVALDQPAVGPTDLGQRLACREVDDLVDFHALVRLAPAKDRNM